MINPDDYEEKELWVFHHSVSFRINPNLLTDKNAWDKLELIKSTHLNRLDISSEMEDSLSNPASLRKMFTEVTELEYQLQEIWGFDRDAGKHYWNQAPHCSCVFKVIDDCVVHGTMGGVLFVDKSELL
jgi:hypothetical protein